MFRTIMIPAVDRRAVYSVVGGCEGWRGRGRPGAGVGFGGGLDDMWRSCVDWSSAGSSLAPCRIIRPSTVGAEPFVWRKTSVKGSSYKLASMLCATTRGDPESPLSLALGGCARESDLCDATHGIASLSVGTVN